MVCKLYLKKAVIQHILLTSGPSTIISPLDHRRGLLRDFLLPLCPLQAMLPSVDIAVFLKSETWACLSRLNALHLSLPHADTSLLIPGLSMCYSMSDGLFPTLSLAKSCPLFRTQPNVTSSSRSSRNALPGTTCPRLINVSSCDVRCTCSVSVSPCGQRGGLAHPQP